MTNLFILYNVIVTPCSVSLAISWSFCEGVLTELCLYIHKDVHFIFILGFCIFAVIFVVGVQLTSTGPNNGRASGSDNLAQAFRSTQKRLQQSESQEADHGGVK